MRSKPPLLLLASLYFAQGLPFGFFTQSVPALLRQSGASLATVGSASLLALPWALKFLWAPWVDQPGSRLRRILWIQAATALILVGAAVARPGLGSLAALALVLNILAATQDVLTDGFAVDTSGIEDRGRVNAIQVGAYRVGMVVGGGAILMFFGDRNLSFGFAAMAVMVAFSSLPSLISREAEVGPSAPSSSAPSISDFLRVDSNRGWVLMVVVYKFGDAMATSMARPMVVDAGLSLPEVGRVVGTHGFTAGLCGALAAGEVIRRIGVTKALLWFGCAQTVSILGYSFISASPDRELLTLAIVAEHFAGGLATTALFTAMMGRCRATSSGTDYTIQASAVVIGTGVASALSGAIAQELGYCAFFQLAASISLLGVIAAWRRSRVPFSSPAPLSRPSEPRELLYVEDRLT
ncbi:MAG: MFS transporter [Deltaproteobacteria bacterium]|nr:MFS transporter [Deltaproteobacteria bacterium]